MYISEIYASGFRCFDPTAPLQLKLSSGLNILVGPNDAGKSAIIDAARYVLWTRGDDYIRPDEHDFHVGADGTRGCDFIVRCTFDDLSADEEARFLEWCANEKGKLCLHVCMRGSRRVSPGGGSIISSQHRAGAEGEGLPLDGELREYLKATYLKPLRDAEREMRAGRRSRLSRILGAMPTMGPQSKPAAQGGDATLHDTLKAADVAVRNNAAVGGVASSVNTDFLDKLSFVDDRLIATLDLGAGGSFDQILERFELYLNAKAGAAKPDPKKDETHQQVQVLLTTHSPQLAAGAELETMTMIVGHRAFPLGATHTRLESDDYEFLRRFLDATKANLFFARALIVVEGDGEHLLLPAIAEKLGRPLSRHGVSIVNVGHRGLFRYSRILQRKTGNAIAVPVALIPDRDIPPAEAKGLVGDRKTENELTQDEIAARLKTLRRDVGDPVDAFIADSWTLEFDLALRPELAESVYQAVQLAKTSSRKPERLAKIVQKASETYAGWTEAGLSATEIAVKIYQPVHDKEASKAEVAEQLAAILRRRNDTPEQMRDRLPPYLVHAIDYVTGGYIPGAPAVAPEPDAEDAEIAVGGTEGVAAVGA